MESDLKQMEGTGDAIQALSASRLGMCVFLQYQIISRPLWLNILIIEVIINFYLIIDFSKFSIFS